MPCDCPPPLQLTSLSDRYVSHFETDGPHVLLYFDSVSVERRTGSSWVSILPCQGRMVWAPGEGRGGDVAGRQRTLESSPVLPHLNARMGL